MEDGISENSATATANSVADDVANIVVENNVSNAVSNSSTMESISLSSGSIAGNFDMTIDVNVATSERSESDRSLNMGNDECMSQSSFRGSPPNNGSVPVMAITLCLILGFMLLSSITAIINGNQVLLLLVYGSISIFLVIGLRIFNARRSAIDNRTSHAYVPLGDDSKPFPKDSYSFIALYGPKQSPDLFSFAVMVFLFQATLFCLMILSVVDPGLRTSGKVDNPDSDISSFAGFIPSNAPPIVRATQIIAILSYMVFPDASLMDISTAVEMFPNLLREHRNKKAWSMACSCILRFVQGILGIFAVFLLVMTSSSVTEIVLNFTAVNFISLLDNTAFEVARSGKYGPMLAEGAKEVDNEPLPFYSIPKNAHLRYIASVSTVSAFLFSMLCFIIVSQESNDKWITRTIQVKFEGSPELEAHNGCYDIDVDQSYDKRHNYKQFRNMGLNQTTQFGYCKEKRRWFLFSGGSNDSQFDDPCLASENDLQALSTSTDSFDISSSFGETWYSASSNQPIEVVVTELGAEPKNCGSYPNDGTCNGFFNSAEFEYDGGDCCAATCRHSHCGKGGLSFTSVFGMEVTSGDGYPNCVDPDPRMKKIQILINDFTMNNETTSPKMEFECDGRTVLSISVDQAMQGIYEAVAVNSDANCTFQLERKEDWVWGFSYEVKTEDKLGIIKEGTVSNIEENHYFSVYNVYDESVLSSNIGTYLKDFTALHLGWRGLVGTLPSEIGMLTRLSLLFLAKNKLEGTLPSEIGLLTNLSELDLSNNYFNGTLPSEIGLLTELTSLNIEDNRFEGSLPSAIGKLKKLTSLQMQENRLNGTLPSTMGLLTELTDLNLYANGLSGTLPSHLSFLQSLNSFSLAFNDLTGKLPNELWSLTKLSTLSLGGNDFTGSLPTTISLLTRLDALHWNYNNFTGTIPSEIGALTKLTVFKLPNMRLRGSIPSEIGSLTRLKDIDLEKNALSGSLPSEVGLLTALTDLNLEGNSFTGRLPSELGNLEELYSLRLTGSEIWCPIPDEIEFNLYDLVCFDKPEEGSSSSDNERSLPKSGGADTVPSAVPNPNDMGV